MAVDRDHRKLSPVETILSPVSETPRRRNQNRTTEEPRGHGVFDVMVCYRQRVRKSTAGCLMR